MWVDDVCVLPRSRRRWMAGTRMHSTLMACAAIIAGTLLWGVCPQPSAAAAVGSATVAREGSRFSLTPSTTEPYAVCPVPSGGRATCTSIIDPTVATPVTTALGLPISIGRLAVTGAAASTPPSGALPACFYYPGDHEYCGTGFKQGLSPQDLQSAYKLPSTSAGSGEKVAIVDPYDDPNAQSDLDVYRAAYDLPPCEAGCFTKLNQEGRTTYPEANAEWSSEISLDLDMVSAACPKCSIMLVEASNEYIKNLGIAENEAAALGVTAISNSYVLPEESQTKAEVETLSKYYKHPGTTITAATGDFGYDNETTCEIEGGKCKVFAPSFPSDLENVIAVGGTSLEPAGKSGRGWEDVVWAFGGSGCSLYVAKPSWQTDKGCPGRTVGDVAAEASPLNAVSVYDTYAKLWPGWQATSGTSAATALVAGAIALEGSTQRSEGVEGIYKHPSNWFDVTKGRNWVRKACKVEYICTGEVGYDGPTGVGTPNGGATTTPPGALTQSASSVTATSAALNGLVNPETSETKYHFEYGETTAYGTEAPVGGATASTYSEARFVAQSISGLRTGAHYHFRIVASSAGGVTYGPDQAFSTPPQRYFAPFGSKGTSSGKFVGPEREAIDGYGNVWITDQMNNRVEEFSPTGEFVKSCGSSGSGNKQFEQPSGIAISPTTGNLYVSDSGNDRIQVLTTSCEFITAFGKPGSGTVSFPIQRDWHLVSPGDTISLRYSLPTPVITA